MPDGVLTEYFDEDQLAREIDLSKRTLKRWRVERVGPPWTRVGRRVVYRKEAVREWLRQREQRPARERATA